MVCKQFYFGLVDVEYLELLLVANLCLLLPYTLTVVLLKWNS